MKRSAIELSRLGGILVVLSALVLYASLTFVPTIAFADERADGSQLIGAQASTSSPRVDGGSAVSVAGGVNNDADLLGKPFESVDNVQVDAAVVMGGQDAVVAAASVEASNERNNEQVVEIADKEESKAAQSGSLTTQATGATSVADGVYTIIASTGGSKCLDVPGGSTANGVGLQIYEQNATAAQRWRISSVGSSLYEIVNVGSGKALDVSGARKASGTVVQQYASNSTAAQRWKIVSTDSGAYKLVSALSGNLVLDVSGGSNANGARVQLWTDNGTNAQRWSLVSTRSIDAGFYVMQNGSGKVLDVSGGSLESGANVQQYAANSSAAQTFYVSYGSSDGYYTITNLGSGRVLDVAGGSANNGANVQQYTPNGTRAQKWAVVKNSNGSITFQSAVSGLALDVVGGSAINGANVQTYASNGTKAQQWMLAKVGSWFSEGAYTIISTLNTNNVVDVSGGSVSNGSNIQVYSGNNTNAQRFYFRPAGNGYYTIQNPISGSYLNVAKVSSGGNALLGSAHQQFKPVFSPGGITFLLKDDTSLVLDISGGSSKSGANLQLYKSNGTAAQHFVVKPTDLFANGAYSIRYAANARFAVDVPNASTDDGRQLQLYASNGTAAQRFTLSRVSGNTYKMTSTCSNKVLQSVSVGGGAYQLQQKGASSTSSNQQWVVSLSADGSIQFAPKSNMGLRIDLSSGTVRNGTPLLVVASNNSAAQKWKLVASSESTAYDALNLTLQRMAELQKSGGNNSSFSVSELIALLDPNRLDKTQFLDVRTITGVTASQLNSFITSTSTGRSGVLQGLGSSFVSAASQSGLNEVYLLAHAILESGWGTSDLAKGYYYGGGTIDGVNYAAGTYYNFYGIGAYDSSPLSGGRKMAIVQGWNSKEKAVIGAAQWIAKNYVYANSYAQPTLYAMKWDYARTNATGERGWHQYATSTSWPDSIARLINQCYATVGGNLKQAYVMPKYR